MTYGGVRYVGKDGTMVRRSNLSWQKVHLRDNTLFILKRYSINCSLCSQPFSEEDFPPRKTDLTTIHHIDGDHNNNELANKVLVHRRCHQSYHMKLRHQENHGN